MENSSNSFKEFKPDWPSVINDSIVVSILPILLLVYGFVSSNFLITLFSTLLIIFFFVAFVIYKKQTYIRVDNDSVTWKALMQSQKSFKFIHLKTVVFFTDAPNDFSASFYGVVDKENRKYSFPALMGKDSLLALAREISEKNLVPVSIETIPWWRGPITVVVSLAILAFMCLIVWFFRNF